jgi:predicted transposase/invertase (TIGR01784 family)
MVDWSEPYVLLDSELQAITSEKMQGKKFVDKLIKVKTKDNKVQIIFFHVEVQGRKEENFEERLFHYYCRLYDKYKLPILTLAILTDEDIKWRPKCYNFSIWNHNIIIFNFFTQKIIDFKDRVQDIFFYKNPLGIVIASQLAAQETRGNPLLRFEKKFSITRQLYQKGLKKDAIITLYKMIDWSIKLPKELELRYKAKIHKLEEENKVSYISSIERISKEEGLQQGREEGIHLNAITIAKKLIAQGRSIQYIQDLTNLTESEVLSLVELEKA